jgi:hypothetical protein
MTKFKIGDWLRVEPESYEQQTWGDNIIEIVDHEKIVDGEDKWKLKFYYDWEEELFIFKEPQEQWMYEDEINYIPYTKEGFIKSIFIYPIPGRFK